MPPTAALPALLAEREDYRNRFETLTLKNQCILWLAAEEKELRQKLAERKKADNASKATPEGRKTRTTAADKRLDAFETELVGAMAAHTCSVGVSAQAGDDAKRARTELRNLQVCYLEVVRKAKLANKRLEEDRQRFVKSAKAAEEASRQLTQLLVDLRS